MEPYGRLQSGVARKLQQYVSLCGIQPDEMLGSSRNAGMRGDSGGFGVNTKKR